MINALVILLLSLNSQAQMKSTLYKKKEVAFEKPKSTLIPAKVSSSKVITTSRSGNLPSYYSTKRSYNSEVNPVLLPNKAQSIVNTQLFPGELLTADITESLIAFADTKAPIRAKITSGKLKGSIIIGEATLEKNSKRILITFNRLRSIQNNTMWQLSAQALDYKGILGIEGEYVSGEQKYFGAEFLASAAAGYADSTVEREQTALGAYVEKPGVDTHTKKALASALSKTAERFSEKLKQAPEYSVLVGTFNINILVLDQPKLITD